MLEPVVPLLVDVLDKQRIEGIDVPREQLPFLLELALDLNEKMYFTKVHECLRHQRRAFFVCSVFFQPLFNKLGHSYFSK